MNVTVNLTMADEYRPKTGLWVKVNWQLLASPGPTQPVFCPHGSYEMPIDPFSRNFPYLLGDVLLGLDVKGDEWIRQLIQHAQEMNVSTIDQCRISLEIPDANSGLHDWPWEGAQLENFFLNDGLNPSRFLDHAPRPAVYKIRNCWVERRIAGDEHPDPCTSIAVVCADVEKEYPDGRVYAGRLDDRRHQLANPWTASNLAACEFLDAAGIDSYQGGGFDLVVFWGHLNEREPMDTESLSRSLKAVARGGILIALGCGSSVARSPNRWSTAWKHNIGAVMVSTEKISDDTALQAMLDILGVLSAQPRVSELYCVLRETLKSLVFLGSAAASERAIAVSSRRPDAESEMPYVKSKEEFAAFVDDVDSVFIGDDINPESVDRVLVWVQERNASRSAGADPLLVVMAREPTIDQLRVLRDGPFEAYAPMFDGAPPGFVWCQLENDAAQHDVQPIKVIILGIGECPHGVRWNTNREWASREGEDLRPVSISEADRLIVHAANHRDVSQSYSSMIGSSGTPSPPRLLASRGHSACWLFVGCGGSSHSLIRIFVHQLVLFAFQSGEPSRGLVIAEDANAMNFSYWPTAFVRATPECAAQAGFPREASDGA